MIRSICIVVIVVVCTGLSEGWQDTLHFDDCGYIYYIHDSKDFLLTWSGEDRGTGCKVTFNGYDSTEIHDEYKVCIKATTWDVHDSGLRLNYYSNKNELTGDLKETFTRNSSKTPETEWCSDSEDYVDVELTTSGSSSSTIELKIYTEKTRDYSKKVGIIVVPVIGSMVLLGAIVIIFARYRRKGISGTVLTYQNHGGQIITTSQTVIQPMAGFQSNAYSSPPPAYNQMAGFKYSGQQQYTGGQMVPNPS